MDNDMHFKNARGFNEIIMVPEEIVNNRLSHGATKAVLFIQKGGNECVQIQIRHCAAPVTPSTGLP